MLHKSDLKTRLSSTRMDKSYGRGLVWVCQHVKWLKKSRIETDLLIIPFHSTLAEQNLKTVINLPKKNRMANAKRKDVIPQAVGLHAFTVCRDRVVLP